MDIEVSQGYTLHRTSACAVGQKHIRAETKSKKGASDRKSHTVNPGAPQGSKILKFCGPESPKS